MNNNEHRLRLPDDGAVLCVVGLRQAAEALRTAGIGWPGPDISAATRHVCDDLYAIAGRIESRARHQAAHEARSAAWLASVLDGPPSTGSGVESVINIPDVGTYTPALKPEISQLTDMLEQGAAITESVNARLAELDNDTGLFVEYKADLGQICERIRDLVAHAVRVGEGS